MTMVTSQIFKCTNQNRSNISLQRTMKGSPKGLPSYETVHFATDLNLEKKLKSDRVPIYGNSILFMVLNL